MDERGNISQKRFSFIQQIVEESMQYPSLASAIELINRLDMLKDDIPSRCSYKISELKSALKSYCNCRSDKENSRHYVMNQLRALEDMVSDEIEDEEWLTI